MIATGFVVFQAKRTKGLLTAAFHKRLTEDEKRGVEYNITLYDIVVDALYYPFVHNYAFFFLLEAFDRLLSSSDRSCCAQYGF